MTRVILIFIPDGLYAANPVKVARLTEHLWEHGQTQNCNSGWKYVEKIADPTKKGWVYDVTEQQLRKALDAAEVARLREIIDGTGVQYDRVTGDWRDELTRRGWRLVGDGTPLP